MSLSSIRAKIKTYIQDVTSLEKTVHDYARLSTDISKTKKVFIEHDILHTWDIKRIKAEREHQAGHGGVEYKKHTFHLRGYYRINDARESEKIFSDTIVESIAQKFIDNPQLEGEAQLVENPIEYELTEEMFCGVLCHKVIMIVNIIERRTF